MPRSGYEQKAFRGALLWEEYENFGGLPPFCQFSLEGLDISVDPPRVLTFEMFRALAGPLLTAHHIRPINLRVDGDNTYDFDGVGNGILLCERVHKKIHRLARCDSEVMYVTQREAEKCFRERYHEYKGLFLPNMGRRFVEIWYELLARKGLLDHEMEHYALDRSYHIIVIE